MTMDVPVTLARSVSSPRLSGRTSGDWRLLAGIVLGAVLSSGSMVVFWSLTSGPDNPSSVRYYAAAPVTSVPSVSFAAIAPPPPSIAPTGVASLRPSSPPTMPDPPPATTPNGAAALRAIGIPQPTEADLLPTIGEPSAARTAQIEACRGESACLLRVIDPARNAREAALRIESLRALGYSRDAHREMQQFVERYPDHPRGRVYRQILLRDDPDPTP